MRQAVTFDYYYGIQADMYSFYRIPKILFTNDYFKNLSCEAKVLYGLMLDRMSLSVKNRWFDKEDRVYIIFTVEDVMDYLNCQRQKAIKIMAELDTQKGIGLIEKKRQGLGKANIIYVKNFVMQDDPDLEQTSNIEEKEPESGVNTQKYENQTSGSMKIKTQEVRKSNFSKCENQTSGSMKIETQEVRKSNGSYTNNNYTNNNYTESNPSIYPLTEEDERKAYREVICQNIEYQTLCQTYGKEDVEELVMIMTDTVCTKKTEIAINGDSMPASVVKSRLLKIDYAHMQYVFECLNSNTTKVRNIRQYLLTVLYNAPTTISHYYQAEVNHDMYGS